MEGKFCEICNFSDLKLEDNYLASTKSDLRGRGFFGEKSPEDAGDGGDGQMVRGGGGGFAAVLRFGIRLVGAFTGKKIVDHAPGNAEFGDGVLGDSEK